MRVLVKLQIGVWHILIFSQGWQVVNCSQRWASRRWASRDFSRAWAENFPEPEFDLSSPCQILACRAKSRASSRNLKIPEAEPRTQASARTQVHLWMQQITTDAIKQLTRPNFPSTLHNIFFGGMPYAQCCGVLLIIISARLLIPPITFYIGKGEPRVFAKEKLFSSAAARKKRKPERIFCSSWGWRKKPERRQKMWRRFKGSLLLWYKNSFFPTIEVHGKAFRDDEAF